MASTLLPRWFTVPFLTLVILVVVPMLAIWPLRMLGREETPRPVLEFPDRPLTTDDCGVYLTELLEQIEDYTSSTPKTARNLGGEFWFETMRSWQGDLERVAAKCELKPPASNADEKHKSQVVAYQKMIELANIFIGTIEPLGEKRSSLLKTARESLGK